MYRSSILTNDHTTLSFQSSIPIADSVSNTSTKPPPQSSPPAAATYPSTLILLLHGFSGSSAYFTHSFSPLSASHWVIAPDLRGHGHSQTPANGSGYHVARLARDLQELIVHLRTLSVPQPLKIVAAGSSLGAAILWTYIELFSDADFAGLIFIDQAPLQNRSVFGDWDVRFAHRGCFDEASLRAAQACWIETPEIAYQGLVDECLGYRFAPRDTDMRTADEREADEHFFKTESRRCSPTWLARLMGDHTSYDHREACELITVPVLVMAGRRSGCFTLEGMREVITRIEKGARDRGANVLVRWSEFDAGHWLFYEESNRFNAEVLDFVRVCCVQDSSSA